MQNYRAQYRIVSFGQFHIDTFVFAYLCIRGKNDLNPLIL